MDKLYTRGALTVEDMELIDQNREGAIEWSVVKQGDSQIIAKFWKEADAALFARAGRMYEILKRMDDLRTAKASIVTHEDFEELYKDAQALYAELSPMLSRDAGEGEG